MEPAIRTDMQELLMLAQVQTDSLHVDHITQADVPSKSWLRACWLVKVNPQPGYWRGNLSHSGSSCNPADVLDRYQHHQTFNGEDIRSSPFPRDTLIPQSPSSYTSMTPCRHDLIFARNRLSTINRMKRTTRITNLPR